MDKTPAIDAAPPWKEIDPEVARVLRPALPALLEETMAAVQRAVPAYEGALDDPVRGGIEQALAGFLELIEAGEEARLPGREVYVAFGRAEMRTGRSLEALLTAYRAGARVAWRRLVQAGERGGLEPGTLYKLGEAIFAYIDELSAASAEGHAAAQSAAAREQQERRHRLIELLLRDPPAPGPAVEDAARVAGWDLPETLAVLALDPEGLERVARRLPHATLVTRIERTGWAIVPDPDGPGRRGDLERALGDVPGALGPAVEWGAAGRSATRAELALAVARTRGGGLVVADDHLLDLLLAQDPDLATDLARRRLEPLDALPATARARLIETLRAWLDAHGSASAAAEILHVHVQTVRYRLGQLRDLLGDALDDPDARLELALALRVGGIVNR